jgi:hypothetical protein
VRIAALEARVERDCSYSYTASALPAERDLTDRAGVFRGDFVRHVGQKPFGPLRFKARSFF